MRAYQVLLVLLFITSLAGCPGSTTAPDADAGGAGGETAAADTSADPEGQRRVASRSDTIAAETETDEYGVPLVTPDRLELQELLRARRFEELETILDGYQAQYQADPLKELWVIDAYRTFLTGDITMTPLLDEWVAARPDHPAAHLARGVHYRAVGWARRGTKFAGKTRDTQFAGMREAFARARVDLDAALALEADLPMAYRSKIFIETADSDPAALELAFGKAAGSGFDRYWVRSAYVLHLLPRWGGSYERMEDFAGECEARVAKDPQLAKVRGRIAAEKAAVAMSAGDLDQAIELYDESISHGATPWNLLGRSKAHYKNHDYQAAYRDADTCVGIRPQDEECLYRAARALVYLGRTEEAIAAADLALALDPADPDYQDFRVKAAATLVKAGFDQYEAASYDDARASLDGAVALDATNAEAYYWRGRVWMKKNDDVAAQADFERAVGVDPHHFESYRNLDYLLAKQGKWAEVIAHWEAFLLLEPDHAAAHLEVAGSYKHSGDMTRAGEHLQRACDLGSTDACAILAR